MTAVLWATSGCYQPPRGIVLVSDSDPPDNAVYFGLPEMSAMYRIRLPVPDSSLLLAPQGSSLPPALQMALLVLLAVVPLLLVVTLYRYELELVPRTAALLLLGLHSAVLTLLVFLVGFQPIYAREVTLAQPGRVLVFVDRSASMDVADPQRTPLEKERLAQALHLEQVEELTRTETARRVLSANGVGLLPAWRSSTT